MDKASTHVGTGLVGAPACGDVMKIQIEVDDDGNIVDAKFKTFGCGSAIASRYVRGVPTTVSLTLTALLQRNG
jgi:NifU-like protein involved in Fe-S cluster formation